VSFIVAQRHTATHVCIYKGATQDTHTTTHIHTHTQPHAPPHRHTHTLNITTHTPPNAPLPNTSPPPHPVYGFSHKNPNFSPSLFHFSDRLTNKLSTYAHIHIHTPPHTHTHTPTHTHTHTHPPISPSGQESVLLMKSLPSHSPISHHTQDH